MSGVLLRQHFKYGNKRFIGEDCWERGRVGAKEPGTRPVVQLHGRNIVPLKTLLMEW